jgi:uncharacterized protein (TIRG00374 family)
MKRSAQLLLGLAISLGCAWLALRNVSLHEVRAALAEASYIWLVPALATLGLAVWMRSERWRSLFPRAERPPRAAAFWALSVGLFFNNVLPLRAGELARVLALNRETGIARTHGLVTVVVERLFDLASLALITLLAWPVLPHTRFVRDLAIASVLILLGSLLVVVVLARAPLRRRASALVVRAPVLGRERTARTLRSLALGLSSLRQPGLALPAALWSFSSWIVLALSDWFVLRAFEPTIDVDWSAAVLVLVATNLALVIPASAASIGVFEVAAQAALAAYGVSASAALSFGLVLHAVNLFPYILLGLVALARMGLSGRELLHASVASDGA